MSFLWNRTANEAQAILTLAKSPEALSNARSLSKALGMTPMGALKLLKRLEAEGLVRSRRIGRSRIYRLNTADADARKQAAFLLAMEAARAGSAVKRWVAELRMLKHADLAVLFGSVLRSAHPRDIDVLLVTDKRRFPLLEAEVQERNALNPVPLHPVYQSFADLVRNIRKKDAVVLAALKGVVALGEERFIQVYDDSRSE